MPAIVLRDPQVTADILTDGVPAGSPADISCHIRTITITPEVDEVDVSTWCNPGGVSQGAPTYTVDIDWIIQDDTETDLAPYIGQDVRLAQLPSATAAKQRQIDIAFGSIDPSLVGAWEAGDAIEASTSHSAISDPSWVAAS